MNVPLNIFDVQCEDKVFHLIQETDLIAGTKQRGIAFFQKLKTDGINEIVTCGTTHGYGQVAAALCCQEVGLLCTIFLPRNYPRTSMTNLAISFGANVIDIGNKNNYPSIGYLTLQAKNYSAQNQNRKMIDVGLSDPDFIQALADNINANKGNINPKRMWIATGSGTLLRAFHKVFPDCHFCIVQVGRHIYSDILAGINYTLYKSPESFKKRAKILPPYRSLYNYDAKIWQFVLKYGQQDDYIWNVK